MAMQELNDLIITTLQGLPLVAIQMGLVCISIAMVAVGIAALYYDTRAMHDWKRRIQGRSSALSTRQDASPSQHRSRSWQWILDRLGRAVKPRQQKELSRTSSMLLQAGYRGPNALNIYYGVKFGLMILLPLLTAFLLLEALQHLSSFSSSSLYFYAYIIAMAAM